MRLFGLLLAAALATTACGGSSAGSTPTAPSNSNLPASQQVATLTGTWNGTSDFENALRQRTITGLTMTFAQDGRQVSGTWRYTSAGWDWRGEISGSLARVGAATEFSGRATFNIEHPTGTGRCLGEVAMTGTVTDGSLRLDTVGDGILTLTPNATAVSCPGYHNFTWILGR